MKSVDLRQLDLVLVCEICDGEVDLPEEGLTAGQCRHCGIAFAFDAPAERRRSA